jgi:hypothetical protein
MTSNKSKSSKGKRCAINTDTTSTTNKQARVDPDTVASKTSGNPGGTSSQSSHCATVATEEEDATLYSDDVMIEETHNSSANESEAESSEVELGEIST